MAKNRWLPIHISRNGPSIFHLFFADDVLLFCKARISQVRLVMDALKPFCVCIRFEINVDRNITRIRRENFTGISSIRFATNLGKYLGFPLISGRISKATFS